MMEPTPLRPPDEVAGGFLRVTLGGQVRQVPVLTIAQNRVWTAHFNSTIVTTLGAAGELKDLDDVVGLMSRSIDTMLMLLLEYDHTGVLGGREWLDAHATDREVYEALKKVTDAAFPFGADLIVKIPNFMGTLLEAAIRVASSLSTSSARRNTAGRRRSSKRRSQTSS